MAFSFDDPVLIGLIIVMVLFVFFIYLLVRRTLLSLREGYDEATRR